MGFLNETHFVVIGVFTKCSVLSTLCFIEIIACHCVTNFIWNFHLGQSFGQFGQKLWISISLISFLLSKCHDFNALFETAIKPRFCQNQSSGLDTKSTTSSHSKEFNIGSLSIVKKFEKFVHKDRGRRCAHTMVHSQDWTDFECRISKI